MHECSLKLPLDIRLRKAHTRDMSSTYGAVAPTAEVISFDEFRGLLDETDSVSVYPRKGVSVRHAFRARLREPQNCRPFVAFDYCNRAGYSDIDTANFSTSIFDFYTLGRIVKVTL